MSNAGLTRQAGHSYTELQKDAIFGKTGSRCTYCGKPLVRENYGGCSLKNPPDGSWEIEHWWAESTGGPHEFENWWPTCCECNDEKNQRDGDVYLFERIHSNRSVNQEIVDRFVAAGPGRPRTGPS